MGGLRVVAGKNITGLATHIQLTLREFPPRSLDVNTSSVAPMIQVVNYLLTYCKQNYGCEHSPMVSGETSLDWNPVRPNFEDVNCALLRL